MAPYEATLGLSWAPLAPSWRLLWPFWGVLEPPCGPLGASCCHPGTSWAIWSPPGAHMDTILPHFGSILDPFWNRFGFIFWHFKSNLHQPKLTDIIQNHRKLIIRNGNQNQLKSTKISQNQSKSIQINKSQPNSTQMN